MGFESYLVMFRLYYFSICTGSRLVVLLNFFLVCGSQIFVVFLTAVKQKLHAQLSLLLGAERDLFIFLRVQKIETSTHNPTK